MLTEFDIRDLENMIGTTQPVYVRGTQVATVLLSMQAECRELIDALREARAAAQLAIDWYANPDDLTRGPFPMDALKAAVPKHATAGQ